MLKIEKIRHFLFLLVAIVMVGSGDFVSAGDALTPANEGVCDSLQGGTPGLYGLCVAYCEAQDLDSVNNDKKPNVKILENYNKKKQAGDPDMPCVQTPCPCFDSTDLAMGSAACTRTTSAIEIREMSPVLNVAAANTGNNSCLHINLNTMIIKSFTVTADEAQSCYSQIEQACASFEQASSTL